MQSERPVTTWNDMPTFEQFAGQAVGQVIDLTAGPRVDCPAGLDVSFHGCVDRWVDAASGRRSTMSSPCRTCPTGKARRQGNAYDVPEHVGEPRRPSCVSSSPGRGQLSAELTRQMVELYERGLTIDEVAGALGVSWSSVQRHLKLATSRSDGTTVIEQWKRASELYCRGFSLRRVGQMLGMTPSAVAHGLEQLGVERRSLSEAKSANKTLADSPDIAAMEAASIARATPQRRWSGEERAKIIELYASGLSCDDIGAMVGVSGPSIYKLLVRHRVKMRSKSGRPVEQPR